MSDGNRLCYKPLPNILRLYGYVGVGQMTAALLVGKGEESPGSTGQGAG